MSLDLVPQPTSIPSPEDIVFVFDFSESDIPVDINNVTLQTYPDYLSLINETNFFEELNRRLVFLHDVTHYQDDIGETITYITDSQGRIFQIDLLHVSGVPT